MNDPDSVSLLLLYLVTLALALLLLAIVLRRRAWLPWLRQTLRSLGVQRTLLWAAVLAVLTAFAWLVWPTPYRYDHVALGHGVSYPLRTHRVTGKSEILYPDRGWIPVPEEH